VKSKNIKARMNLVVSKHEIHTKIERYFILPVLTLLATNGAIWRRHLSNGGIQWLLVKPGMCSSWTHFTYVLEVIHREPPRLAPYLSC